MTPRLIRHGILRTIRTSLVLCFPLLTGCLILAKEPNRDLGEVCESDKDCDEDYAYCATLVAGAGIGVCAPKVRECEEETSPICGGALCDTTYGFCYRGCDSDSECALGYYCAGDTYDEKGTCSQCNCGGFGCFGSGTCDSTCFDNSECLAGYRCLDYSCVPL